MNMGSDMMCTGMTIIVRLVILRLFVMQKRMRMKSMRWLVGLDHKGGWE